jgi:hypothetical protein
LPAIIDTPVFILGNPRSGTSLLRLMISSHSKISIPPESGFLVWWYEKYKDWSKQDSSDEAKIDKYLADLKTSKKIETWNLDYVRMKNLILAEQPANYAELSSLVYYSYSLIRNKNISIWGDKNNYYIAHLQELKEIYPNAFFIHIIRDGRDVACSYLNIAQLDSSSPYKPKLPYEIAQIAHEWSGNNLKIRNFMEWLEPEKKLTVKYEDLIESPADHLQSVCKFLALPYEEAMMNFHNTEKEPEAFIDWKKKTMEKPDPTNKNMYLNFLTHAEIGLFNQHAADVLNLYGYSV